MIAGTAVQPNNTRPDFLGRAIILSACSLPAIFPAGCRKEAPPQPYVRTIDLEALDASCTEAWLRVRFTDSAAPRAFALKRDGQTILSALNSPPDTLVIDEGLLPNRTYTYKAYRLEVRGSGFEVVDSSTQATVTTMDTTSHNFTWQIDTLGDGGGSVLYDVAIINDTLAYAVGEVYKRDSLGNWDPNAYNLVKWNGNTWELKRIPFIGPCSAVDYPPLTAIWAFSANHILVTNGGAIVRYDGTHAVLDCGMNSLLAGAINKLYATNPQDVYLVGNAGTIAHYDGVRWRRIETTPGGGQGGTTLPMMDIWGSPGGSVVWAVGYSFDVPAGTVLMRIRNSTVEAIRVKDLFSPWPDSLSGALKQVWTDRQNWIYVLSTFGIYRCPVESRGEAKLISLPGTYFGYTFAMRGIASNDVSFCDGVDGVWHFNGASIRRVGEFQNSDFRLRAIACRNDRVIAVGRQYHPIHSKGLIVRGRRI